MAQYLLGIDVGTTNTKGLLVSEAGGILAQAELSYALSSPGLLMNEQNPDDWWNAVVSTVRNVTKDIPDKENITAISLSTQGGTLVSVDSRNVPLRPAIVWSDQRCGHIAESFARRFGERAMYEKSGWQLHRGLNALQIAWLRENEPDVFRNTRLFLSVADYLSLRLTGIAAVDMSNVGINQLADIRKFKYDADILDFVGIDESQLAKIVSSGTPIGTLTADAAKVLGLQAGTLLVSGAHDQYAASLGVGITQSGQVLIGTGTAWVVTALTDTPNFDSGFSQSVSAIPGKWGSMVSLPTGGVSLEWFRSGIAGGRHIQDQLSFDSIDTEVAGRRASADGLMFFPYFNGGTFPLKQQSAKASLLGLDLSQDRFSVARAVMEGVSFHVAWILEHFKQYHHVTSVSMSGGAAKSAIWTQMVADIAGCPIGIPNVRDLSCVGAAILAGVGSGVFQSLEQACGLFSSGQGQAVAPNPGSSEEYAKAFTIYKRRAQGLGVLYEPIPAHRQPE